MSYSAYSEVRGRIRFGLAIGGCCFGLGLAGGGASSAWAFGWGPQAGAFSAWARHHWWKLPELGARGRQLLSTLVQCRALHALRVQIGG